jgi:ABC-type phosphate/phosphonate transport system substrate-binding protein
MWAVKKIGAAMAALVLCASAFAAEPADKANRKVSFVPTADAASVPPEMAQRKVENSAAPLIFSAPPHESSAEATRIYQPIAAYFSRVLGRAVEYKHPGNWLSYQKEMSRGDYDLVFDGPHLTSWRIAHLQHNALAKIVDDHSFAVVVRKDEGLVTNLKQLAGKKICAMNVPNLDTLALLAEFEPFRQPLIIEGSSWQNILEGVSSGRCTAGTIPSAVLRKLDPGTISVRIVHQSPQMPNGVFSAGTRLTGEEQLKLAHAIVAPEAKSAMTALLSANGAEKGMGLAYKEEYKGQDGALKDVWGLRAK